MPLSGHDNESPLFHDDAKESGDMSGPQTVNIVNPSPTFENMDILCTSHQNCISRNNFKNNNSSQNETITTKSESPTFTGKGCDPPGQPAPLVSRSLSSGVLKRTESCQM